MSKSVDHLPTSPNISTWATRHGELVPRSYGCQWRTFRGKSALFGLGFGTLFQAWKRFPDLRTGLDLNGLLQNIARLDNLIPVGKHLWKIRLFLTLWLFPVASSTCCISFVTPIQSFVHQILHSKLKLPHYKYLSQHLSTVALSLFRLYNMQPSHQAVTRACLSAACRGELAALAPRWHRSRHRLPGTGMAKWLSKIRSYICLRNPLSFSQFSFSKKCSNSVVYASSASAASGWWWWWWWLLVKLLENITKHELVLGEKETRSLLSSRSTLFLETSLLLSTFPVLLSNLQLQ